MLTTAIIDRILDAAPGLTIGVLGDLFLDRYLDLDARLTEPSIETGLDAYQVSGIRSYPGAAGTVINNLAALGVGRIVPVSVIGDDGEGFDLRRALGTMSRVQVEYIYSCRQRFTPTYTKPMLHVSGQSPRELNRIDIKNHAPLPVPEETRVIQALGEAFARADAWVVLDQVSEENCGVVTGRVRERLSQLARQDPDRVVLADSRERIGLFGDCCVKPNERECCRAADDVDVEAAVQKLSIKLRRPVFCTRGEHGILVHDPRSQPARTQLVPGFAVSGPIDPVGAGDSASAGIVCALAAKCSLPQAAAFANLVASITIQQLGTTGTASPEQVRRRWSCVSP